MGKTAPPPASLAERLRQKWLEYWYSPQPKSDLTFFCTFLAIVFVINATVAGNVRVPTGSMKDTIREHERFIVRKLGYGIQNPFSPRHKLTINGEELLRWKDVARGDIVMFVPPEETDVDEKYVKRLIGLPGELVEVRPNDGVYINQKPLEEPYVRELPQYWVPPQVVPADKVFVLGDNRNNSYDSHAWGFLDLESVQGVMSFRYWPLNRVGFLGENARRDNVILAVAVGFLLVGYFSWRTVKRRRGTARESTARPSEA